MTQSVCVYVLKTVLDPRGQGGERGHVDLAKAGDVLLAIFNHLYAAAPLRTPLFHTSCADNTDSRDKLFAREENYPAFGKKKSIFNLKANSSRSFVV